MCIAAWAWQSHPTHRLLLFNHGEYHSRPTRPAQWWATDVEEGKEILGGRDELGGGTWLGCTRDGKLAFLTNVREPSPRVRAKSRGELPVRFLQICIAMNFYEGSIGDMARLKGGRLPFSDILRYGAGGFWDSILAVWTFTA